MRVHPFSLLFVSLSVAAVGCKSGGGKADGGPGINSPDLCSSMQKATSVASCELALGQPLSMVAPVGGRYISVAGQEDWYSVQSPSNADSRSLLHVTGGYEASNTAINFSTVVLAADGQTVLISGADNHGQAAPEPVDLIMRYTQPSQTVFVRVQDQPADPKHPNIDVIHPYDLTVNIEDDPDTNEPNDTTPTPVTLSAGTGGTLTGTQQGFLSLPGDVDEFSVTVPPSGTPQILYVGASLTKVDQSVTRPPNYLLSYQLLAPDGGHVSEGHIQNQFLSSALATAREVGPGTYTVVIQAYTDINTVGVPNGDLSYQYSLQATILPEQDIHEPDDNVATVMAGGAAVSLNSVGGSGSVTGRLSYIPDRDFYKVHIGATGNLHYKLAGLGTGGRFPPLPGPVDRQVRGFSVTTSTPNCLSNSVGTECPKNGDPSNDWSGTVDNFCSQTPPLCLWTSREEDPNFPNLGNVEGVIPVTGGKDYAFLVEDNGNNWADDKDYQLSFDLWANTPAGTGPVNINSPQTLTGNVNAGYGRLYKNNPNSPTGPFGVVRGPNDYDAVLGSNTFELDFTDTTLPLDKTWDLSWNVPNFSDGGKPFELILQVQFCTDTGCATPVQLPQNGFLADIQSPNAVWWMNPVTQYVDQFQVPYTLNHALASDTVTAKDYACTCLEPRFAPAGKFFVTAFAADKIGYSNNVGPYTITTGLSAYPKSFAQNDGGTRSCPAPTAFSDGGYSAGCKFAQ